MRGSKKLHEAPLRRIYLLSDLHMWSRTLLKKSFTAHTNIMTTSCKSPSHLLSSGYAFQDSNSTKERLASGKSKKYPNRPPSSSPRLSKYSALPTVNGDFEIHFPQFAWPDGTPTSGNSLNNVPFLSPTLLENIYPLLESYLPMNPTSSKNASAHPPDVRGGLNTFSGYLPPSSPSSSPTSKNQPQPFQIPEKLDLAMAAVASAPRSGFGRKVSV